MRRAPSGHGTFRGPGGDLPSEFSFGDIAGMKLRPVLLLAAPVGPDLRGPGCLHFVSCTGGIDAFGLGFGPSEILVSLHEPENRVRAPIAQAGHEFMAR